MQTLKLQNVLLQNRSQTQLKIYRVPFLVKGGRALRFERHVAIIRITFTSFVYSISLSIAVVSVGFFYAIPSSSLRKRRKTEAQHHRTYNEFSIHWIFPNPDVLCWILFAILPHLMLPPFLFFENLMKNSSNVFERITSTTAEYHNKSQKNKFKTILSSYSFFL